MSTRADRAVGRSWVDAGIGSDFGRDEVAVCGACRHEIVVIATRRDLAISQVDDLVGVANSRQPMRNQKNAGSLAAVLEVCPSP